MSGRKKFESPLTQRACPPDPAQPQDWRGHTHGVAIIFFSAAARSRVIYRNNNGGERVTCQPQGHAG